MCLVTVVKSRQRDPKTSQHILVGPIPCCWHGIYPCPTQVSTYIQIFAGRSFRAALICRTTALHRDCESKDNHTAPEKLVGDTSKRISNSSWEKIHYFYSVHTSKMENISSGFTRYNPNIYLAAFSIPLISKKKETKTEAIQYFDQ